VEEALRRAGRHARASLAEAIAATRALLDAASLAAVGVPSSDQQRLAGLASALDALALRLAGDEEGAPLFSAVFDALDEEIARWEARSREDAEARPVLRAFLGLREILWELGVRPEGRRGTASQAEGSPPRRVERVPVES
jgi:hypothetical protein